MNYGMSENKKITPRCPKCDMVIISDDINVAKDIAYCRSCNITHKFSAIINKSNLTTNVDFNRPPSGIKYNHEGLKLVVSSTHRSLGSAVGILAAALFWNGIVSVFVLVALASTLSHLNIQTPEWFPAPDMNGEPMSLGFLIFLWIFLTPFILIGLTMIGTFFMTIGGRTEAQIDRSEGMIFTGFGPLGYRRRFQASRISDVRIEDRSWRDSDGDRQLKTCIVIETHEGKLIRFGSMLSEERRKFMAALLYRTMVR